MNPEMDQFVRGVKEKMEAADAASGRRALELQAELSAYIAGQMQNLMSQGVPVMELQDALRAATDRVEQTYAPDADEPADASGEEPGEGLEPPVSAFTFFLPLEETVIAGFASGGIDGPLLMERIRGASNSTALEMTEGLELVLSDFGKNRLLCRVITGGEIVAGSDGEAFMPEYLTVKEEGCQYLVSDPAVFKSAEEVQSLARLLEPFDRKIFFKKADIKKLIKFGWLEGYDLRQVKKEAQYIIDELWKECTALKEVYRRASEQRKGMLIFAGCQGAEGDDCFET